MARRAASTSASTNKCVVCDRTFARLEHLKRHLRSHTRDKPFKCLTCGKNFSRLDVLNRHHTSHQHAVARTTAAASDRACRECAAMRVRCSRGDPCSRCEERDLDCTYPAAKKRRTMSPGQVDVATPPLEDINMPSGLLQIPSPSATASNEDTRQPVVANEIVSSQDPIDCRQGANRAWLGNVATNPSIVGVPSNTPWIERVGTLDNNGLQNDQTTFQYNSLYGLDPGDCYVEQAMGVLSTNWMSPPQQNLLDWGSQLAADPNGNVDSGVFDFPLLFNAIESTRGPITGQPPPSSSSAPPSELDHSDKPRTRQGDHPQHNSMVPPATAECMSSLSAEGEYYVDGAGARAPFQGQPIQKRTVVSVEATTDATIEDPASSDELLSGEAYYNMVHGVQAELEAQALEVDMSSFPSQEHVRAFVVLYFEKFHPIYPFLRKSAFSSDSLEHWILLLAVATVGARYTQNPQGSRPREILLFLLQKFMIRRMSGSPISDDGVPWIPSLAEAGWGNPIDLPSLQANVLNVVCMLYSGRKDLMRRAFTERYCLVNACDALNLLAPMDTVTNPASANGDQVRTWLKRQSRIRTGMMIWALDCMLVFEFGCKPLMRLTDAVGPLPCLEGLWENPSVGRITSESSGSATLLEALELLYMEKRLPSNLSQFGTILLIYAICRKTKETICENRTQLSSWTPSAKIQSRTESNEMDETWPPSTLLLSNWRNSASDCLDILHWCANGIAARAAGWEGPIILHLHLARLILLTPTEHLQVLATTLSSSSAVERLGNTKYVKAHKLVLRWALRDQFKARLSVIHAGALFWHVRRFSSNSFVEPFAIYIATLVVWAYSIMSIHSVRPEEGPQAPQALDAPPSSTRNGSPQSHLEDPGGVGTPTSETELCPEPSFVHLDRPCDDEMVQTYVRFGHRMAGYMLRVGNICDRSAPRKILEEGIRLLIEEQGQTQDADILGRERQTAHAHQQVYVPDSWGIERSYAKVLRGLIQGTMQHRS